VLQQITAVGLAERFNHPLPFCLNG
jgi:hypothetical protein